MYILSNRATGHTISQVELADFQVLQNNLVRESEQDYDFYINPPTIDFLKDAGLSQTLLQALSETAHGRGIDVGWEVFRIRDEALYQGVVIDESGHPLGGIRIDLLDSEDDPPKDWAYSRFDGSFALGKDPSEPGSCLRLSGRGDLVLDIVEIKNLGDQGELAVQTVTGVVTAEDGTPLSGVSVQLLNWELTHQTGENDDASLGGSMSWGDTDEAGAFAIPVRLPLDDGPVELRLELLAQSGESLLEPVIELQPASSFELGTIVSPVPRESWGEEEMIVPPTHEAFEHPLG